MHCGNSDNTMSLSTVAPLCSPLVLSSRTVSDSSDEIDQITTTTNDSINSSKSNNQTLNQNNHNANGANSDKLKSESETVSLKCSSETRTEAKDEKYKSEHSKQKQIVLVGGTGMVGRRCFFDLSSKKYYGEYPKLFCIGSGASAGRMLKDVALEKDAKFSAHYGLDLPADFYEQALDPDAANMPNVECLGKVPEDLGGDVTYLSFLAPEIAGPIETKIMATKGVKSRLISNSPFERLDREKSVLIVPQVNYHVLESMKKTGQLDQVKVKTPNCCSIGSSIALKALHDKFGVSQACIVTCQALTGRGDSLYAKNMVKGNVLSLDKTSESVAEKVVQEVKSLFQGEIKVSATSQRVCVATNHYLTVMAKLGTKPTSVEEVEEAFRSFCPQANWPQHHNPLFQPSSSQWIKVLPDTCIQPSVVTFGDRMTVFVGDICVGGEVFDITFKVVFDNLVLGAYGTAVLIDDLMDRLEGDKLG